MKIEECTVVSVFPERGTVRVRREQSDGTISAELPILFQWTLKNQKESMPSIDEHVVCIFTVGSQGYVLGAMYSEVTEPPIKDANKHSMKFEDGAQFEYDTQSHELTIQCNTVKVTGDILCNGDVKAGSISLKTHTHSCPDGETSKPN